MNQQIENASNWFSRNWVSIILSAIIVAIIWLLFNSTNGLKRSIELQDKKIIDSERRIDSTNKEIEFLKEERVLIKEAFTKDSLKLVNLKIELTKKINERNEKINIVDSYTDVQSQEYFSNRYPE